MIRYWERSLVIDGSARAFPFSITELTSDRISGLMVSTAMLIPEANPLNCPVCGSPIPMTVAATLRARLQGAAVACEQCGGAWLYTLHPLPEFGPLTTPKRRRGPPRKHYQEGEIPPPDAEDQQIPTP